MLNFIYILVNCCLQKSKNTILVRFYTIFAIRKIEEAFMEFQSKIVDLLDKGKADEAIELATEFLTQTHDPKDQLYYLRGNAYRKKGDWQHALNDYLEAITINPESPAKHAYDMAIDILNFFNKDMYNQ